MRLRIGTRVPHDVAELSRTDPPHIQRNCAVYRIVEVIAESPWVGLYRGEGSSKFRFRQTVPDRSRG